MSKQLSLTISSCLQCPFFQATVTEPDPYSSRVIIRAICGHAEIETPLLATLDVWDLDPESFSKTAQLEQHWAAKAEKIPKTCPLPDKPESFDTVRQARERSVDLC